jgi:hypothetical protein
MLAVPMSLLRSFLHQKLDAHRLELVRKRAPCPVVVWNHVVLASTVYQLACVYERKPVLANYHDC